MAATALPNLNRNAHIHMIGICGVAMASLAGILKNLGFRVTGSDENVYPPMSTQLKELGIEIQQGYKKQNLQPRPDLVIVGNVISRSNPEAETLLASDIPYTSLPKAMGEFVIGTRDSLVVAGTHGKTTTTSLMSWMAQAMQAGAGFLIGGIPKNFNKSFQVPEKNLFIIEGDEYDTAFFDKVPKFVHYRPKFVILTSIEFDHADIYPDLDAVKKAFGRLLDLIPRDGILVASGEDQNIASIIKRARAQKVFTYGIEHGDYVARKILQTDAGTEFEVFKHGVRVEKLKTLLMGEYNVRNALGAYAMATEMGWAGEKLRRAIATFEGVKRRQEILGEPGGVLVIEDFAHHPTAVQSTIAAMKARYPGRRLFAVFEPRSATSRRKVFQKDYVTALSGEHTVILPPAYNQEKIEANDRFSVDELVSDLRKTGTEAEKLKDVDAIVKYLGKNARSGDLILIMSNGGFGGIYQKLLAQLG